MVNHNNSLKPGQKFPTPTPGFGDRVFYETLLRQRPDSAMAQEWCVSYGVLDDDEAERLWKKVTNRKRSNGNPNRSPEPTAKKNPKKKKPRILQDDGVEPDLQVSSGDGIGLTSL
jgi:hypothetical protein